MWSFTLQFSPLKLRYATANPAHPSLGLLLRICFSFTEVITPVRCGVRNESSSAQLHIFGFLGILVCCEGARTRTGFNCDEDRIGHGTRRRERWGHKLERHSLGGPASWQTAQAHAPARHCVGRDTRRDSVRPRLYAERRFAQGQAGFGGGSLYRKKLSTTAAHCSAPRKEVLAGDGEI